MDLIRGEFMKKLQGFRIILLFFLCTEAAFGGGKPESSGEEGVPRKIVQAGSSAFIVADALYLFPEAFNVVNALSKGDQGKGFFVRDLDPAIRDKTIMPPKAGTESILARQPDVVVMKDYLKGKMGMPLEKMGVPVFYLNLESPEAWFEDLDRLGELFQNPRRANELKGLFQKRLDRVSKALAPVKESEKPRVLFLYWSVREGASAINVPPVGWMQTRMVEMAGGIPVWKDAQLGKTWTQVNMEQVAAWDPDLIYVAAYHVPVSLAMEEIQGDPVWASLRAVQNHKIFPFPGDYYSWDMPDVRWLLGLTWMAENLHPEYLSVDMRQEVYDFYRDFYDMDKGACDKLIFPRLNWAD